MAQRGIQLPPNATEEQRRDHQGISTWDRLAEARAVGAQFKKKWLVPMNTGHAGVRVEKTFEAHHWTMYGRPEVLRAASGGKMAVVEGTYDV